MEYACRTSSFPSPSVIVSASTFLQFRLRGINMNHIKNEGDEDGHKNSAKNVKEDDRIEDYLRENDYVERR
jgi:hypothetical protein